MNEFERNNTEHPGIPETILSIIESRGIGKDMTGEFFSPRPRLAYDPFLLANMREGVDLLLDAIDSGKRIVIYGDYDVDGITSTSLMMKVIRSLTDNVTYYIPSRLDEGYGLHRESIDRIHEDGGEFIITVDCGSVSREETAYAHSLGIETLVTDHHNISDIRAEGLIINPRLAEDEYPFKGLAGVGVAYKVALAVARQRPVPRPIMAEILEFVTVGTIADIMPMLDENRTIVKCGLRSMHLGCRNRGLRKLMDMSGLDYRNVKASDISYGIAPKINASGRLGDASLGVRLFLAETDEEAEECCRALIEANQERRRLQDDAYDKGLAMIDDELARGDFVMVEINDSHEGVLGIVAGKLREKVGRPVVVISRNEDTYKGTGRSIPGIDLFRMLDKYRDKFISFGGHSAACGFTISADRADELRRDLNLDIAGMLREDSTLLDADLHYDALIKTDEVDMTLAEAIEMLEPCGKDNEMPVFAFRNVSVSDWRFLKNEDKMARFSVSSGRRSIESLLFHDAADICDEIAVGGGVLKAHFLGSGEHFLLELLYGGVRLPVEEADRFLDALSHFFRRIGEGCLFFIQHAGDPHAVFPVKDIAKCIQRDDCADLEIADFDCIAADAGLHAALHAGKLADGCAAASAEIPVLIIGFFKSAPCSLISHRLVRIDIRRADGEVEKIRLYNERHFCDADIEADAFFVQEFHDTACCRKSVGASTGNDDAVNPLGSSDRT